MSFAGGGSDLPSFYQKFGGAVVSTAINKYVYVTVNKKFDNRVRVSYSKTEEVDHASQVEHQIVRACLEKLGIPGGVEITSIADIPSQGTGLGSSSSFTVGLLHCLNAYNGRYVSRSDLGRDSCHIEIEICGERIGKQDQYAAAYGGFNFIRFEPDDTVVVEPVICGKPAFLELQGRLLMFYTGLTRRASSILSNQSDVLDSQTAAQDTMRRMVDLAHTLHEELRRENLDAMGDILHQSWLLKRNLTSGISSGQIDNWYERARAAGALGGKILGAGGGGFLLLYARPEDHGAIEAALPDLRRTDFCFDHRGSRIILFHND